MVAVAVAAIAANNPGNPGSLDNRDVLVEQLAAVDRSAKMVAVALGT